MSYLTNLMYSMNILEYIYWQNGKFINDIVSNFTCIPQQNNVKQFMEEKFFAHTQRRRNEKTVWQTNKQTKHEEDQINKWHCLQFLQNLKMNMMGIIYKYCICTCICLHCFFFVLFSFSNSHTYRFVNDFCYVSCKLVSK